jgi:hypothetical protein
VERPGHVGATLIDFIVKNNESRPTTNNRGYDSQPMTALSFVVVDVTVELHSGAIPQFQFH